MSVCVFVCRVVRICVCPLVAPRVSVCLCVCVCLSLCVCVCVFRPTCGSVVPLDVA